jgi:glycerol transport system ATP-binding protein
VTHDQTEALTFADQVAVMYDGEIVQVGTPAELFDRPRHTFVGHFIGSPGMNILPARVDGASVRLGEHSLALASAPRLDGATRLELGVRPEFVRLSAEGIPASVQRIDDAGRYRVAHLSMLGHPIAAMLREGDDVPADAHVAFDPAGVHLYADSWRVDLGGAQ